MNYFHKIKQPTISCSKCGSTNIAKPVNEENALWIYKCMNCGHTLSKQITSDNGFITFWSTTKDTNSNTTTF